MRISDWSSDVCSSDRFAGLLLGPLGFRTAVSRGLVYGMSRVFLGDRVADQLSVPDGPAKHVLRVARPGLRLLDRARHGLLGAERLTAAGYAARDEALVRMKAEQGIDRKSTRLNSSH